MRKATSAEKSGDFENEKESGGERGQTLGDMGRGGVKT